MTIKARMREKVCILECAGDLTLGAGELDLRRELEAVVARGEKRIVLDYRGLRFMDSAGVGETVACAKRALEHLVRGFLHAFNEVRARTQPRTGRVFKMRCGASETPRRMHALDAGERKVEVVNIAGVVYVGGQDSSNIGKAEVADFRVNAV